MLLLNKPQLNKKKLIYQHNIVDLSVLSIIFPIFFKDFLHADKGITIVNRTTIAKHWFVAKIDNTNNLYRKKQTFITGFNILVHLTILDGHHMKTQRFKNRKS